MLVIIYTHTQHNRSCVDSVVFDNFATHKSDNSYLGAFTAAMGQHWKTSPFHLLLLCLSFAFAATIVAHNGAGIASLAMACRSICDWLVWMPFRMAWATPTTCIGQSIAQSNAVAGNALAEFVQQSKIPQSKVFACIVDRL